MFNDVNEFYPTPDNLIYDMLRKIDFRFVNNILEPSAGRGNIVDKVVEKFKSSRNYRYNKEPKWDIDTIEINENLRHILSGKGYRVIADDYLNFHTYKRYDLIIANPPYSNGDKHLMKMIQMQEQRGGKILCLLNAETIRNPYSNIRKELINKLDYYNAEIEFKENAFTNSEHRTDVEIAIIYIDIPKVEYDSAILNELKKEESYTSIQYDSTQLIQSDFIKGIVSQYEYEVKAGLRLIEEYNSIVPYMLRSFEGNSPVLKLELEYKDDSSTLENAYIKQIRSKYWKALFSNDQFMGLFTSNLKAKYMQMVNELQDYDFSFYNIYSLRIELSKEMVKGVEDTILSLFEEFSNKYHYYDECSRNVYLYNGWKTNKAYKINKKVIIPLNGFTGWSTKPYTPTHYTVMDKLKDVEKVFNYLDDGTTEEIDLQDTLKFAEHYQETKKIELKYFYVSFFKKQTCHIEFKNMDLLNKFNQIAAKSKNWLPPTYGKVKYDNMSKEEKQVIDEFEGKESYNKVMSNPSYYILKTDELLRLTS
jgi:hypothetical protein